MKEFRFPKSCFIIAEISANHGRSFQRAASLIKMAKTAGADAVKFQVYTPETISLNSRNKYFMIQHPQWGGQSLFDLYQKAYTPWSWFKGLKRIAEEQGLVFFASVFDKSSVDFLEGLGVSLYKIASFELVDLPLIAYAAKTKKPIIISTGMATKREIDEAVQEARKNGAKELAILKCVSSYPADPSHMNLRSIPHMQKTFGLPIGLSDHTLGVGVSVAAVTLGARVIEKHIISSRRLKTPDHFFSMEPHEFKLLVESIRTVEKAMGKVHYGLTPEEYQSRIFRRSLFVVKDIKKGELLSEENVRSIRPANGLAPKNVYKIIGKRAQWDLKRGTPLTKEMAGVN